jgi:Transposase IS66 family
VATAPRKGATPGSRETGRSLMNLNPGCASSSLETIRYTLSRWQGLTRFLDDGCIELDSNAVERAIRPIALNTHSSRAPTVAASIGPSSPH